MMRNTWRLTGLVALFIACCCGTIRAAPLANPGDFIGASIFTGTNPGASDGNPNADGQGWYRCDMATKLNYYTSPKWATGPTDTGFNSSYSEATNAGPSLLRFVDDYWGRLGIAWTYTNQAVGRYAISCTGLTNGSYFATQFLVKTNSSAAWAAASSVFAKNAKTNALVFTNWLGRGGGLAFRGQHDNSGAANANGTISGLRVSLLELATNTPAVTLSISTNAFSENPLWGNAFLTAQLSQFLTSDVTVNLSFGGTAVKDVDYTASATQLVIVAGDLAGSLALTAIDDAVLKGNRTITVGIGSLVNATNGTPTSVTTTLVDDEAPLVNKGDVLRASVFFGPVTNTSAGNPNLTGQGWYRKDLVTPLNYYTNPSPKWATSTNVSGSSYSEVTNVTPTQLRILDNYSGALGVGWVYTNTVAGTYMIACTNISGNGYNVWQVLLRSNAVAPWIGLSGVTTGNAVNGFAYTNVLPRGGGLAFKTWNSITMASYAYGNIYNLQVTLLQPPPSGTSVFFR